MPAGENYMHNYILYTIDNFSVEYKGKVNDSVIREDMSILAWLQAPSKTEAIQECKQQLAIDSPDLDLEAIDIFAVEFIKESVREAA